MDFILLGLIGETSGVYWILVNGKDSSLDTKSHYGIQEAQDRRNGHKLGESY